MTSEFDRYLAVLLTDWIRRERDVASREALPRLEVVLPGVPRAVQYLALSAPLEVVLEGVLVEAVLHRPGDLAFAGRSSLVGTPIQICVVLPFDVEHRYLPALQFDRHALAIRNLVDG